MKRILFVCSGLYGGGAERVVARLSNYFVGEGHQVYIAATKVDKSYTMNDGVQVRHLKGGHIGIVRNLRTISRELHPDVMIAMGTFFNYCAILAKTKGCVVIGSERTDPAVSGKGFIKRHFRNYMYRFADHLVFQTPDAKAYFPDKIRKRGIVIPNPLSPDLPAPFVGKRSLIIVNFCRLNPAKNIPLLIDSFKTFWIKHPEYSMHIYGEGPQRDELQTYIEKQDMSYQITLYPNNSNVLDVVKDAAMFVSSSSYEGLSNSMLEAMAIGLPTICTACPCGGAKMMIKDGVNGLLVPNRDKDALAQAMIKVAEDQQLAAKLSENAVKIRETLSISKIAQLWESLF